MIFADKFAAQIPILEEKVKHLGNKVVDGLTEVRSKELCVELMMTTRVRTRNQEIRK
jgi:hypothetical protein